MQQMLPEVSPEAVIDSESKYYLDEINKIRVNNGLKPLKLDNTLISAANTRAQEASQLWSHTRPDGTQFNTASNAIVGENLAYSNAPKETVIKEWLESPSHRDILLADDISTAGLSVYNDNGIYYIALEVGKE